MRGGAAVKCPAGASVERLPTLLQVSTGTVAAPRTGHDHRTDVVVPDAKSCDDARTKAFDHDIGVRGEFENAFASLGLLQVELDAALVRAERDEQLGVGAHRVATGWLHLQHIGPDLREELRRVRTRSPHAQVEHAQTCE